MAKKNMAKPKNRVDNCDNLPTSPVTPIRLCAFQATRRPAKADELEIVTAFGEVTVTGRIGQSHADFLDCVMHHREGRFWGEGNRLMVRFDPHELRMAMGGGDVKYSAEQMKVIENAPRDGKGRRRFSSSCRHRPPTAAARRNGNT